MSDMIPPNRIRDVRKAKKLTLQQLADAVIARGKIPMQQATLTRIETRQKRISDEQLAEIAAVLGVDPDDLMMPEPEKAVGDVEIVPLRSLARRSGRVGIRIQKAAAEAMLPQGSIAVVDLDDTVPSDGWWAAIAGVKVGVLHCEDGIWTDALREGNPQVKADLVEPLGRIIEYRVSLVGDTTEADDAEDDIYVEDTGEQPDEDQIDGFVKSHTRK